MRNYVTILLAFLIATLSLYSVPYTLTYQGKLLENGNPISGVYSLGFAIFDSESGGVQIWPAAGYESHNTNIDNGLFTVILGKGSTENPLQPGIFTNNSWLEIKTPSTTLPRIQLHNVPYSLQAENLSLRGNNIGDLLMWDGNNWIPTTFKSYYRDLDGDGYGDQNFTIYTNNPLTGYVEISGDCNDHNNLTNPGAAEIIGDGIDNNCNGLTDESN